jgi:hypothetical protein
MSTMALARGAAGTRWFALLALLSLGAAAIHFAVVTEHFAEWWAFGVFFIALGAFEAFWAGAVVLRPSRLVIVIGIAANVATVLLWAVSRTAGLPIGPEPWMPEEIGVLDVAATTLELLLVAGLAIVVGRSRRTESTAGGQATVSVTDFSRRR